MNDQLPTRIDFAPFGSLDELSACDHMLGKTRAQVGALLADNFLFYQEDFLFMGPVAFCYYVDAIIDYVVSEADLDECRTYLGVCAGRLEFADAGRMAACADRVAESLDLVARRLAPDDPEGTAHAMELQARYRELSRLR